MTIKLILATLLTFAASASLADSYTDAYESDVQLVQYLEGAHLEVTGAVAEKLFEKLNVKPVKSHYADALTKTSTDETMTCTKSPKRTFCLIMPSFM